MVDHLLERAIHDGKAFGDQSLTSADNAANWCQCAEGEVAGGERKFNSATLMRRAEVLGGCAPNFRGTYFDDMG